MMTTSYKRQPPIDAGSLSLDLLATVGSRLTDAPVERLESVGALSAWLKAEGFENVSEPCAEELMPQILRLREDIHEVLDAVYDKRECPPDAIAGINWAARCGLPLLDASAGIPRPAEENFSPQGILGRIALDAVDLLTGPRVRLLHRCEGLSCDLIFIDSSPSKRRRWCSSQRCGNRARVASFRESSR